MIQNGMESGLSQSKESGFWKKVDYDFRQTVYTSIGYLKTIISDLKCVEESIKRDFITEREIKLLRTIGRKSIDYNIEYGHTFKSERKLWHDYGNPDFEVVENMYAKGRDYFVSLQDAGNIASRLEDYMQSGNATNVNFHGNVTGSQIQVGTVNSTQISNNTEVFPYEDVMKVLSEINKYKDRLSADLGENGEKFCETLAEVTDEVQSKGNPSKIKTALGLLRDFVVGVSGSLAASGVLALLHQISI